MPQITFDFSEPQAIYDPNSKGGLLEDSYIITGVSQLMADHKVHLQVIGKNEEAVQQFARQFNKPPTDATSEEATDELFIKRKEPEDDEQDSGMSEQEERIGETNLLIAIHYETGTEGLNTAIHLDIDPPIMFKINHVYTFSSNNMIGPELQMEATHGAVTGQMYRGLSFIIERINPLLATYRNREYTTDNENETVGAWDEFLDTDTMQEILRQLDPLFPEPITSTSLKPPVDITPVSRGRGGLRHYALVIEGKGDGESKYRLIGKIERRANAS